MIKLRWSGFSFDFLKKQEYFSVMIFLILMEYRSKAIRDIVKSKNYNFDDINLEEILLNDIYELSKCRSVDDVKKSTIDPLLIKPKIFYEILNYYVVLAETTNNDFILSSIYPVPWGIEYTTTACSEFLFDFS